MSVGGTAERWQRLRNFMEELLVTDMMEEIKMNVA